MKILLIEDDKEAAHYLKKGLIECGYDVEHAADGERGLQMSLAGSYDILIVDRMLPKRDGLSIIKMLRADGKTTPALVLSALGEVDDRVEGLRAGGDDYLVKPYAFTEILARIEALTRRASFIKKENKLSVDDLEINLLTHRVTRSGERIHLQPKELKLLEYLMRNANKIVTRTMLLEHVWGFHFDPGTNVIDTQISRLRRKIDHHHDTPILLTIRGRGYLLGQLN